MAKSQPRGNKQKKPNSQIKNSKTPRPKEAPIALLMSLSLILSAIRYKVTTM